MSVDDFIETLVSDYTSVIDFVYSLAHLTSITAVKYMLVCLRYVVNLLLLMV